MVTVKRATPEYRVVGNYIEIELRSRKRIISLRVDEDAIRILDRFIATRGTVSRTLFISKIIEALAEGINIVGTDVKNIKLIVESEGGEEAEVNIPISQHGAAPSSTYLR